MVKCPDCNNMMRKEKGIHSKTSRGNPFECWVCDNCGEMVIKEKIK